MSGPAHHAPREGEGMRQIYVENQALLALSIAEVQRLQKEMNHLALNDQLKPLEGLKSLWMC